MTSKINTYHLRGGHNNFLLNPTNSNMKNLKQNIRKSETSNYNRTK